jgi:hypothetical protein
VEEAIEVVAVISRTFTGTEQAVVIITSLET